MAATVAVGKAAPDFDLTGIDGRTGEQGRWRLADFAGRCLVVAFYPADHSSVCTRQLQSYTEGIASLTATGAAVVAISPQGAASHREFAAMHQRLAFPLLSDEDKAVGRSYGILGLLDLYRRSTFVVDRLGRVAFAHRAVGPGLSFVAVDELSAVLAATC